MSETIKFPKLSLRCKDESRPLSGGNAILTLDDVPLRGVTFLKLELKSTKVAKVYLEMIASVDVKATIGELIIVNEQETKRRP